MTRSLFLFLSVGIFILSPLRAAEVAPFEIRDGDRVLFLGDTLLERESTYGYLETRMHEQFPDRRFTARNLAFAGDTPLGWSRASFDPPAKGFEQLKAQIALVKPTVVFLGYGMAASLQELTDRSGDITLNRDAVRYGAEPMSAARFKKELAQLMDAIEAISGTAGAAPAASAPTVSDGFGGTPKPAGGTPTLPGGQSPPKPAELEQRAKPKGVPANEAEAKPKIDTSAPGKAPATPDREAPGTVGVPPAKDGVPPAGSNNNSPILRTAPTSKPARDASLTGTDGKETPSPAARSAATTTGEAAALTGEKAPRPPGKVIARNEAGNITVVEVAATPARVRFVLLSPIRHEDLRKERPGLPDPAPHNALLEQYTKAIEELAKERGARFLDVAAGLRVVAEPLTENGIHLSRLGHDRWAAQVKEELMWGDSARAVRGHSLEQTAALRTAVAAKNELFFHRWRPQNSTYLFGFRKHEQGRNAAEIPQFDPLIEKAEAEIDRLKKNPSSRAEPRSGAVEGPGAKTSDAPPGKPPGKSSSNSAVGVSPVAPGPSTAPLRGSAQDDRGASTLPQPTFDVAEGLEITLWAENPLLEKPTQMNWDAQGRLWVTSSGVYPQIEPGVPATDRVIILEDTDRDGKADKSIAFAEGLLIPTGVEADLKPEGGFSEFGKTRLPRTLGSGCYVGQSTELLHFSDSNGDGKADTKRIVLSGFGTEDTHHIIHTLRWGPDGRLYFNQSIYIHTHLETPWGMVRLNSGGVFAYDPRSERVEVLFKGFCNPWGHAWDKWGQSFITDGAGFQGISWGIPGAQYFTYENGRQLCPSISPGSYPKFCGLELVYSPHFPADWQGSAVTCDFRAHRIVRFGINDLGAPGDVPPGSAGDPPARSGDPAGTPPKNAQPSNKSSAGSPKTSGGSPELPALSGYITKEMPDLVRTADVSFRPIDIKLGPDGALYVADWSNPVINHGEVDFRDPRRDKTHGRIWRIAVKGRPAAKLKTGKERFETERAASQIFTTVKAVSETGDADTLAKLPILVRNFGESAATPKREEDATNRVMMLELEALTKLEATDPARAAGLQRIQDELRTLHPGPRIPDSVLTARVLELGALSKAPRVRVEAMRALCRIPTARSAELVLQAALNQPGETGGGVGNARAEVTGGQFDKKPFSDTKDPHYGYAAWLSINDLAEVWTGAIASGEWQADSPEKERQLAWGLSAIRPELASATLAKLVATDKVPFDGSGPWFGLLGSAGGPGELARLFERVSSGELRGDAPLRALRALADAARLRSVRPSSELKEIAAFFDEKDPALTAEALRIAGLWKVKAAAPLLAQFALSGDAAIRGAAIEGLRELGGGEAIAALSELSADRNPAPVRRLAAGALAALDMQGSLARIAEVLTAQATEADALEAWRAILAAKSAPDTLAGALPRNLAKPVASAGLRAARELGKKGEKLVAALTPLAGVGTTTRTHDYQAIAALTKRDGDPARGEEIYRRTALVCVTCHAIGGAGGKVGPELTSMGASAPLDYIIESMLDPAAKVKEGFNAVTLTLKDGTVATGIQARETAQEIFVRNAVGAEQAVPKATITGRENIGSIMPAGLIEQLKDRERLDLYAFLGQLGKPGVYDASKGNVARVWWLYPAGTEAQLSGKKVEAQGAPAFTFVDGRLPRERLTESLQLVPNAGATPIAVAKFQLPAAGKVKFNLTGIQKAYLDGQPLAVASEPSPSADLPAGEHTLAVKLDIKALPEMLRAAADGVRFLTE